MSASIPMTSVVTANHVARSPVVDVVQSPFGVHEPDPVLLDGFAPGTNAKRP